jgi:uncharacterized protein DUF2846
MIRTLALMLLLAAPLTGQNDDAARARIAAGCGADEVRFDVKTDKKQHPTGTADAGHALVYVFADTAADNAHASIGGWVTRFGVDGSWVGATNLKSYFFFPVDPGEHRLCASMQSKSSAYSAAITFSATAGGVYYFSTKDPTNPNLGHRLRLATVNPAEGDLLVASSAYSTFQQKK